MDTIYMDTLVCTVFAIIVVAICLYSSYTLSKFKDYAQDRDKMYMSRIDNLENLIKTEFVDAIKELKKAFP